jgi:hypothetical protein
MLNAVTKDNTKMSRNDRPTPFRTGKGKTRRFAGRTVMNTHPEAFAEQPERRLAQKRPLDEANHNRRDDLKAEIDEERSEAAVVEKALPDSPPLPTAIDAEAVPAKPHHPRGVLRPDPLRGNPSRKSPHDRCSRLNCATGVWRYAAGYWFL